MEGISARSQNPEDVSKYVTGASEASVCEACIAKEDKKLRAEIASLETQRDQYQTNLMRVETRINAFNQDEMDGLLAQIESLKDEEQQLSEEIKTQDAMESSLQEDIKELKESEKEL